MKLLVMSILDNKVGAFTSPFYSRAKGEAIRSFSDAVNEEKSQFNRHIDDYALYLLGVFDDNTGMFVTQEPQRVITARECKVISDRMALDPDGLLGPTQ